MLPSRSGVVAVLILCCSSFAFAGRFPGLPADPAACRDAALASAARLVSAGLRCHAAAAARGKRAPRACVKKPTKRFAKALRKVDGRGACLAEPTALYVVAGAQALVEEVASLLRPDRKRSRCASAKLRAAGDAGERFIAARAQARSDFDMNALAGAVAGATGGLESGFAAAESGSDCQTYSDFGDALLVLQQGAGLAGTLGSIVVTTKTVEFPPLARQDVLDNRAALEAQGLTVSDDGATVTGDTKPAGGWIAQLGDQRARIDSNGFFQLDVPPGSALEGQLFHPANRDAPVARFFLVELAGPFDVPAPIALEITTQGSCNMDVDPADDPPSCHAGALQARAAAASHLEPRALNPDPAQYPPKVDGPLGSYPNTDPAAEQVACLDYDGYIQTGERGDGSIKGAIAYPGSTCQKKVDEGCCDNEAATIRRHLLRLVDEFRFPVLGCVANHKGRYCQQITKGDVAAEAKGQLAKTGGAISLDVRPGENVPMQVHNNACYGETFVSRGFFSDLGGSLVGDRFDGETLRHWDDTAYYLDSPLVYFTPLGCETGQRDDFEFQADDGEASVTFVCVTTTTTTTCQPGYDYSCQTTTTTAPPP